MTLARFSHLEEVPELGQSEVTGIVQVRRLEEPELKDVIWWCGNHLKAIILCDYVISILFCKYVYHHKYIYILIYLIWSYHIKSWLWILWLICCWSLPEFYKLFIWYPLFESFWCSCVCCGVNCCVVYLQGWGPKVFNLLNGWEGFGNQSIPPYNRYHQA